MSTSKSVTFGKGVSLGHSSLVSLILDAELHSKCKMTSLDVWVVEAKYVIVVPAIELAMVNMMPMAPPNSGPRDREIM